MRIPSWTLTETLFLTTILMATVTANALAADAPLARWRGTDLDGGAAERFGATHHGEAGVNYVYARPTGALSRLSTEFELERVPEHPLFLHLYARDDNGAAVCPIEIRLNNTVLFQGPNTFPKTGFTRKRFSIPPGLLKPGRNHLLIANSATEGQEGMPPWFMVSRVAIGTADCNLDVPNPIEKEFVVRLPTEKRPVPEPAKEGHAAPAFPLRGTKGWCWFPEQYLAEIPVLARFKMNFLMNCYTSMFDIENQHYGSGQANQWWEPLPDAKRAKYEEVVRACQAAGIEWGFCMNPNFATERILDYDSAEDIDALWQHYEWMAELGVNWFSISLDDISRGVDAVGQSKVANEFLQRLRAINPDAQLILCPTYYWGVGEHERYPWDTDDVGGAGAYLAGLAEHLHPDIYCFWTGDSVVGQITRAGAETFKSRLRHRLILWDNYPVNDQHPTLHLGPVMKRDPDLYEVIDGYMANPLSPQNEINRVPLITQADYAYNPRGYDPARSIGQAIVHLAETPEQREALRDLVELYPGMLVYGRGPDWNPVVTRFAEIIGTPHSRSVAVAYLRHAEDVAARMETAFSDRFQDAVELLRANIETMQKTFNTHYGE